MSFQELKHNIEKMRIKTSERRNCVECDENETCIKCIFPYPLSSKEYCKYKQGFSTINSAKMIDIFSSINDYIFRPINLLEF
jgi:hypothetical protein